MRLLFRQRMFAWFDSYSIYDEEGRTVYEVRGKLAWGHKLEVYDAQGQHLATLREEVLSLLPRFAISIGGREVGKIHRKLSLLRPRYALDVNGWQVQGDLPGWNYRVVDQSGGLVMTVHKKLLNLTDTYELDISHPQNALLSLMIVLAIDAAICTSNA